MSQSNKQIFLNDIRGNHVTDKINYMLSTIDTRKSECWKLEDRDRIFNAVESTKEGFDGINTMIFDRMRQWVIDIVIYEITQENNNMKILSLKIILATLYSDQGIYDKAESLYIECLNKN
jgi:hypothetical protein